MPPTTFSIKRFAFLLLGGCVIAFIAFAGHRWFDIPFYEATTITDWQRVQHWEAITDFGLSGWYLAALPILFVHFRFLLAPRRVVAANRCAFIFCAILSAGLLVTALKPMLGRARPTLMKQGEYGYTPFEFGYHHASMPSGHAATVASLAACLWVLFPRWRWMWLIGAVVIAASRMVLGSHFLSDVLVAACLSVLMMLLTRRVFERRGWDLGLSPVEPSAAGGTVDVAAERP